MLKGTGQNVDYPVHEKELKPLIHWMMKKGFGSTPGECINKCNLEKARG